MNSILPTDSRIIWSPGNVFFSNDTAVVAQNSTYFKMSFTGTSLAVVIDVSIYQKHHIAANGWGQWVVSVGDSEPKPIALPEPEAGSDTVTVTFASGLPAAETHGIQAWFDLRDETDPYSPKNAQIIKGFVIDDGAEILAPAGIYAALPTSMMIMGDSITKGYHATDPERLSDSSNYPLSTFAVTLGMALGCEYGIVGHSGQGWINGCNPWNVFFPEAFPNYFTGQPRVWPAGLRYLVVAQGTNDWQDFTSAVETWLPAARKAVGIGTWIILVVPFSGLFKSHLETATAAYQKDSGDQKVAVVAPSDVISTKSKSAFFARDTIHPNPLMHPLFGAVVAAQIAAVTSGSNFCE